MAGTLVAIEGIDGAGKSLLIQGLVKSLYERGISVSVTEEPTKSSEAGLQIRNGLERHGPEEELELFLRDRESHHVQIEALRETNEVVILDRYYISSMAYQGPRLAKHLGKPLIEVMLQIKGLNENIVRQPDLVIILDVDPKVAFSRVSERKGGKDKFEGLGNLLQVRNAFKTLVREDLLDCPLCVVEPMSPEDTLYYVLEEIVSVYERP